MSRDRVNNEYFEWISDMVCDYHRHSKKRYRRLLSQMHIIPFRYSVPKDTNRANDGIELRYRFAYDEGYREESKYLDGPCSVLEMLAALALRWEEDFMDNPTTGNRTSEWFWLMVQNIGLEEFTDNKFNKALVLQRLDIFLDRRYCRNGDHGNIIVLERDMRDLRNVEIWYQVCWYINEYEKV